ncbi:C-terminal processing protease CtpA/Prc, contains a PDZ domain [Salinimicrobium sediminis]|uniref:C-terminal processing protease CtpA/Prc, contains a PDZ domain n=1 Tax=Salinimicrobium sediminis TaxID=1343891 RepID=A0A285X6U7_9FLAO|nr:S41 family peptidase [Salinimicrobium sediminis]SOC81061.1 C-terminal processing protease CtpA/Prc, contains a PDZ domain [Salinimicrobium sediminis]
MKMKNVPLLLILSAFIFTSCSKDEIVTEQNLTSTETGEETAVAEDLEVEEFIYDGLNEIYLYKADVPVLADDYFKNTGEKSDFLAGYSSPEDLFDDLISSQDRFSFISDNYKELEDSFDGISSSTAGMKFGLGKISGTNNIFAFLQYIIPGTSAEEAGLTRGTVFTEVNGQKLTLNNFSSLLDADTFTINIGYVEDGTLVLTDKTATLTHSRYTANPVHLVKTIEMEGRKIGYLMYNSFVADFDDELNSAFAQLKSEGVTELILDLRYNGGGSVESAVDLASMITGQFEGQIFMKEQWNEKYQTYYEQNDPESLINRFNKTIRTGENINSLNLSKVYVLTTNASASASELVINGLEPYINVVQVGETTTGKFQASVTLYDSDDFGRDGANKNHTYAIQPLVLKSANAQGKSDYVDGLAPDVSKREDISNLGILGDPTEPFLEAALNHIFGRIQQAPTAQQKRAEDNFKRIGESGMYEPGYQKMYLDKLPPILKRD